MRIKDVPVKFCGKEYVVAYTFRFRGGREVLEIRDSNSQAVQIDSELGKRIVNAFFGEYRGGYSDSFA